MISDFKGTRVQPAWSFYPTQPITFDILENPSIGTEFIENKYVKTFILLFILSLRSYSTNLGIEENGLAHSNRHDRENVEEICVQSKQIISCMLKEPITIFDMHYTWE